MDIAGSANSSDDTNGPFLSVNGAGSPFTNGMYVRTDDPACETPHYYAKGDYRLLWEPGPQVVHGLRWTIFAISQGRDAPLYYKSTWDERFGWRGIGSVSTWSAGAGAEPAPLVDGDRSEEVLQVSGAGDSAINGVYIRVDEPGDGVLHPPGSKFYKKGAHVLMWEPGPEVTRGLRWVLSGSARGGASQERPYYHRLSPDGAFARQWVAGRGAYPAPRVDAVQTEGCLRCPPGSYSKANWTACLRCPAGRYSLGGADECSACEGGTFADSQATTRSVRRLPSCGQRYLAAGRASCTVAVPGASACERCAAGRFSRREAGACDQCTPGFYSEPGAAACQACPAGSWSGTEFASCVPCSVGRFGANASAGSSDDCALCAPGRYGGTPGGTACTECAAGFYAATFALSSCKPCPPGTYSATPGVTGCGLCPNRTGGEAQTAC